MNIPLSHEGSCANTSFWVLLPENGAEVPFRRPCPLKNLVFAIVFKNYKRGFVPVCNKELGLFEFFPGECPRCWI